MNGTRHTFASYFSLAIDLILKALWREGYARGPQELIRLTWNRLRRLERRFDALVAQWRAGTLPAPNSVGRRTSPRPSPQSGEAEAAQSRPPRPFPRACAWIIRQLVPQSGPPCVGTLCLALNEPEIAEFYAAAPQLGRILRPLAHMIGAPLPEWLKLPKRKRARTEKKPLPPHPAAARFPDTPAARSAARALARMQAGLPVNLRKLSAVALGYVLHPPRDGNCPPPEIGYAPSRWRPPKDYQPPNDWD